MSAQPWPDDGEPFGGPSVGGSAGIDYDRDGEEHSGQVRMAYRLTSKYADRLMAVANDGWYHYDDKCWREDQGNAQAKRAAIDVLSDALAESVGDKQLRADVNRCESAAGINGVLDVASALKPLSATVDELDADPYLLNCPRGTLDLRTRELRPHDPRDRITKMTTGSYDPSADPRAWLDVLATAMPDEAQRDYFQRVAGLSVVGLVHEHIFPVLIGTGANSKGTVYGAICHALGNYATVINPDLLLVRDRGGIGGPEMMQLRGARLAVGSESGEGRKLDEAVMKRLSGGDQLTARKLYKDPVTWQPSHQLLYVTNSLPTVKGDDPAVWRRMRVIPFDVVIPPELRDPELPERLKLHADAILTWAVQGYFDYKDNGGMREPQSVLMATDAYREDSDTISRFIADCCRVSITASAPASELYRGWQEWAVANGADALSDKAFAKAMDRRGFASKRTRMGNYRAGIELRGDLP